MSAFGRRAVTVLVCAALAASPGVGLAGHRTTTTVLRAEDGIDAAVAWSRMRFPAQAEAVLLATAGDFADALAGGLAQATLSAPLLLTAGDRLDQRVREELDRLGATTAHLLGGTGALSEELEAELTDAGLTVERHSGATRIETAIALAQSQAADATGALLARAFADSGGDPTRAWADSLAAGALSAQTGQPLLLTATDRLPASLSAYLDASKVTAVTVVGGTAAVSDAVASQLGAMGVAVERVSGATRAGTAVALAKRRGFADASAADAVIVTEGQDPAAWTAGIAAAGQAAELSAPMLLTIGDALPPESQQFLQAAADSPPRLVCAPLLPPRGCDAAAAGLGLDALHENATATDAPELKRVELRAAGAEGVLVRYVFDEEVRMGPGGAARFRLAAPDTTAVQAAASAVRSEDDPSAVDARFAAEHTAQYATMALADAGAVEDAQGTDSPDGSAELAGPYTPAGRTRRPDLVGAEAVDSAVVLRFDAPVDTAVGRNVAAVREDGSVVTGGNATVADAGRTVRVSMDGLVATAVRRVAIRPGAVMTRQGSNPLAVVGVAGGLTEGADLVSVTLRPTAHQVDFVFDADLLPFEDGGDRALFRLRYEDGTEVTSAATTEVVDARTVRARFPDGAVNRLVVAAAAGPGAVVTADDIPSADDAKGLAREFAFAESFGPRLVGAERIEVETEGVTAAVAGDTEVRLTFDRAVAQVTATRIAALDRAGTRVPVSGCSVEPGIAQDTVVCQIPPPPVGQERRTLVAVTIAYDAVRGADSWRTGTEPASGFGRGVTMLGLPMTLPFTATQESAGTPSQPPAEEPTEEPTEAPSDTPTETPTQ